MKINFISLIALIFFFSCRGTDTPEIDEASAIPTDTVLVENDYPPLTDPIVLEVMESLQICSLQDTNTILPDCDASNFRVFPLGPDIKSEKGFILEMKEGVFNSPVKQVMVIQKSFNKYKIVNRYLGFLIEYRTLNTEYNHLLIGYKDIEMGLIAIRHEWHKENYQPVDVEEINGYYIKEEYKDSINDLFLENFNAGY